jgi:inner membrane protein
MPSTIVHLALAGLIGGTLLGEAFDGKSLLVIAASIILIDLDSFVDLFVPFGHRAVLHNLLIPALALGILLLDVHVREESTLLDRWGHWGYRVAWVTILCYAVAGVLLDMTDGVVNLFWPIHDQFYALSGKIELSDQRGFVQTFIETSDDGSIPAPESRGTTEDVEITTGVAPGEPDAPNEEPERIFPVIGATWELIVFLTGTFVTGMRLYLSQELDTE